MESFHLGFLTPARSKAARRRVRWKAARSEARRIQVSFETGTPWMAFSASYLDAAVVGTVGRAAPAVESINSIPRISRAKDLNFIATRNHWGAVLSRPGWTMLVILRGKHAPLRVG